MPIPAQRYYGIRSERAYPRPRPHQAARTEPDASVPLYIYRALPALSRVARGFGPALFIPDNAQTVVTALVGRVQSKSLGIGRTVRHGEKIT